MSQEKMITKSDTAWQKLLTSLFWGSALKIEFSWIENKIMSQCLTGGRRFRKQGWFVCERETKQQENWRGCQLLDF